MFKPTHILLCCPFKIKLNIQYIQYAESKYKKVVSYIINKADADPVSQPTCVPTQS